MDEKYWKISRRKNLVLKNNTSDQYIQQTSIKMIVLLSSLLISSWFCVGCESTKIDLTTTTTTSLPSHKKNNDGQALFVHSEANSTTELKAEQKSPIVEFAIATDLLNSNFSKVQTLNLSGQSWPEVGIASLSRSTATLPFSSSSSFSSEPLFKTGKRLFRKKVIMANYDQVKTAKPLSIKSWKPKLLQPFREQPESPLSASNAFKRSTLNGSYSPTIFTKNFLNRLSPPLNRRSSFSFDSISDHITADNTNQWWEKYLQRNSDAFNYKTLIPDQVQYSSSSPVNQVHSRSNSPSFQSFRNGQAFEPSINSFQAFSQNRLIPKQSLTFSTVPGRKLSLSSSRSMSPYSYYAYQSPPIINARSSSILTNRTGKDLFLNGLNGGQHQSSASFHRPIIYQKSYRPSIFTTSLSNGNLQADGEQQRKPDLFAANSNFQFQIAETHVVPKFADTPPVIKFSVKDGIDGLAKPKTNYSSSLAISRIEPRTFSSVSDLFESDPLSESGREPKKVRIGSFMKPSRSLWRSENGGRVYLEKYDMSDIFCKTKFKPILSPLPDNSRDGRQLKRSSSKNDEEILKQENARSKFPISFVNSEWTPLAPPAFRVNRRIGSIIIASNQTAQNHTKKIRQKRSSNLLNQEKAELGPIIEHLPESAVIKRVDPDTAELLLRLLRNSTSAQNEFRKKNITKVFYVHLDQNTSKQTLNRNDNNRFSSGDYERRQPANNRNRRPTPYQPSDKPVLSTTQQGNNLRSDLGGRRRTTTTTTTTTQTPIIDAIANQSPPAFVLNERDYEYGELLCEGRFSGGVPDLRNDCRLYFECNPSTIDTYACPEGQKYDLAQQRCIAGEMAICPNLNNIGRTT